MIQTLHLAMYVHCLVIVHLVSVQCMCTVHSISNHCCPGAGLLPKPLIFVARIAISMAVACFPYCLACPLIFSLADKAALTLTFQHWRVRTLLGQFLRGVAHFLSSRLASLAFFLLIATWLDLVYGAVSTV